MPTEDQLFERIERRLKTERRRDRVFLWYLGIPLVTAALWSVAYNWLRVAHPTGGTYMAAFLVGLIPAILVGPRCMAARKTDDEAERTGGPSS